MPDNARPSDQSASEQAEPRVARDVADDYVLALADLDPTVATSLGLRPGEDGLPDLSPAGQDALDELARTTLTRLASVQGVDELTGDERRCARLLRERLEAGLA